MTRLSCIAGALLVAASTAPVWAGQGEPTILLHETFDDNGAGWKEQQTTWIRSSVQDGVFRITTQVTLQQTVVRNVELPATGDVDVKCTVEVRRGNPEWPVGLVWGYRNPANFLEYVIWMDGRFRITRYVEDLEAWEQQAGVRVESGDIVFVRTGRWARRADRGPWQIMGGAAGLHASVAPWLHARGVAVLGSDAVNDVFPSGIEGASGPIHLLTIVTMGMPLFDNLDLEAVAAEAARQNRWEFLVVAAPLGVEGGTGSPLNPLAIF